MKKLLFLLALCFGIASFANAQAKAKVLTKQQPRVKTEAEIKASSPEEMQKQKIKKYELMNTKRKVYATPSALSSTKIIESSK